MIWLAVDLLVILGALVALAAIAAALWRRAAALGRDINALSSRIDQVAAGLASARRAPERSP